MVYAINSEIKRFCLKSLFVLVILLSTITISPNKARATCCGGAGDCGNACCSISDCIASEVALRSIHMRLRINTEIEFSRDLRAFENWLIETMFKKHFLPAMADMTTQMNAVAMQYTQIIGSFLDAQNQMDTQRLFRKLQYDANKDYRPSDDFCWFGTNIRSLAASESKGEFNSLALSRDSLTRQLGTVNTAGASSDDGDYKARWKQFVDTYCDPNDNNYQSAGSGLTLACDHDGPGGGSNVGAQDHKRVNSDIDYTRLVDEPRTIDVDFTNGTLNSGNPAITIQTGEEEDIIALSRNLYGHKVLSRDIASTTMTTNNARKMYLALRGVAAKRNVAQASFNAIIGLKSSGSAYENPTEALNYPSGSTSTRGNQQTSKYMAAIINQLLPSDPDSGTNIAGNIFDLIGHSPSYYAQLEVLAKRIYQNPDFYANLYDTPANVSRKKVAMKAIELMIDREIYESQLRREMSISVLLSSKLRALHRTANGNLGTSSGN